MNAEHTFQELAETIVQALVDEPDNVSIVAVHGERTTVLELRVAQSDLGKIIGKQGRNAKSIRTILQAVANKYGRQLVVEIVD